MFKNNKRKSILTISKNVLLKSNESNQVTENLNDETYNDENENTLTTQNSSLIDSNGKQSPFIDLHDSHEFSRPSTRCQEKDRVTEPIVENLFSSDCNNKEEFLEYVEFLRRKIEEKITEFSLTQTNHFESIRQQIDLRRQTLIQNLYIKNKIERDECQLNALLNNINMKSDEIIQEIQIAEEAFRQNFDRSIKPYLFLPKQSEILEKRLDNFNIYIYDLKRNRFELPNNEENAQTTDKGHGIVFGRLHLFKTFLNNESVNDACLNVVTSSFYLNHIDIINLNTKSLIKSLIGHKDGVKCVVFYNENTRLISGSQDKTIKIWNLIEGECVKTLEGHKSGVTCLKLVNDENEWLASGSNDGCINLWDLKRGNDEFKLLFSLDNQQEHCVSCLDQFLKVISSLSLYL